MGFRPQRCSNGLSRPHWKKMQDQLESASILVSPCSTRSDCARGEDRAIPSWSVPTRKAQLLARWHTAPWFDPDYSFPLCPNCGVLGLAGGVSQKMYEPRPAERIPEARTRQLRHLCSKSAWPESYHPVEVMSVRFIPGAKFLNDVVALQIPRPAVDFPQLGVGHDWLGESRLLLDRNLQKHKSSSTCQRDVRPQDPTSWDGCVRTDAGQRTFLCAVWWLRPGIFLWAVRSHESRNGDSWVVHHAPEV